MTKIEKEYEELSAEFTILNQEYNKAVAEDKLTDEVELKFMRAERDLNAKYKELADSKTEKEDN